MLTLAPIACILAAIGLSAIMTRFAALVKTSPLVTGVTSSKTASSLSPSLSIIVLSGTISNHY